MQNIEKESTKKNPRSKSYFVNFDNFFEIKDC